MEINGINGVNRLNNERLNNLNTKNTAVSAGEDNVEISDQAKRLAEIDSVRQLVETAPDIREDRIAEVKAKLESGAYDNEEVLNAVAEKLMSILDL